MTKLQPPRLFLILCIIQALHSSEEIFTRLYDRFPAVTGHIHDSVGIIPVVNMSGLTFVILNILVVTFMAIVCFFVYRRKRWAWRVAQIAAIVEIINGILHISAAIYTGGYWPGAISAAGLFVVGVLTLRAFMSNGLALNGPDE